MLAVGIRLARIATERAGRELNEKKSAWRQNFLQWRAIFSFADGNQKMCHNGHCLFLPIILPEPLAQLPLLTLGVLANWGAC